ncbi:MAG: hypothetical protein ACREMK_09070 [Gemmatimonadota bacterium]
MRFHTRSFLLASSLVIACAVAPGQARGQVLRYDGRPGEGRVYARTQTDHVTQTVNGIDRTMELESFWRFSATVREIGPESLTLAVVHDSIAISGMPADSAPDFSSLYGRPVTLVIGRRGEVRSITPPEDVDRIERLDLDTTYRTFFPTLPSEPVAPGTAWADTLVLDTSQNGLDIRVERINRYEVAGRASSDGPVDVNYTMTLRLEGEGRQQGAEVSLTGTGSGEGRFVFDPQSGGYLSSDETSDVRMDAFVAAGGQNLLIPIVQHRTEKVEALD